jgi:hypothetical protein
MSNDYDEIQKNCIGGTICEFFINPTKSIRLIIVSDIYCFDNRLSIYVKNVKMLKCENVVLNMRIDSINIHDLKEGIILRINDGSIEVEGASLFFGPC